METDNKTKTDENALKAEGDSVETVVSAPIIQAKHMVFVYSSIHVEGMGSEIRVLYYEDAAVQESHLKAHGWIHTATLNPAEFIKHLANSDCDVASEIDDLFLS